MCVCAESGRGRGRDRDSLVIYNHILLNPQIIIKLRMRLHDHCLKNVTITRNCSNLFCYKLSSFSPSDDSFSIMKTHYYLCYKTKVHSIASPILHDHLYLLIKAHRGGHHLPQLRLYVQDFNIMLHRTCCPSMFCSYLCFYQTKYPITLKRYQII